MKYELFPLDELPPGSMRAAQLDRIGVVVIRKKDGELRVLRDVCPHLGARLSRGTLQELVVGDEPGQRMLSDELIVRCPWHGHEFDLDTGRCEADEGQGVRVYDVSVENGIVAVER